MARRPGAAQAQDSDSQLVKPTLSLLAALRREHREPTEPRTGKPPPRPATGIAAANVLSFRTFEIVGEALSPGQHT